MGNLIGTIVIGILLLLTIIILVVCIITKEWKGIISGSVFTIILTIFEIFIVSEIQNTLSEPTALDIYRGLTELEITSVNGVPKDTVVVFKNR